MKKIVNRHLPHPTNPINSSPCDFCITPPQTWSVHICRLLVRAKCLRQRSKLGRPLFCIFWSEWRCADSFVESAVGHYFWYFSTLLLVLVLVLTLLPFTPEGIVVGF